MTIKKENKLNKTTRFLQSIGYEFSCVIDNLEKWKSLGANYSDEDIAYKYKNNEWKNEWCDEYRDSKGNLTETFFEDVNEGRDFIQCDSCNKWGEPSYNYIFEGDFYCDLCSIKDTLKDFDEAIEKLKKYENENYEENADA